MSAPMLTSLLKQVSRSFYLTMRVLPEQVRPQISIAYLLARTSDTIADTGLVGPDKRVAALGKFRARLLGRSKESLNFGDLAQSQSSLPEKTLLERVEESIALLSTCSAEDQQRIRDVLTTITSGQELDLFRFSHASEKRIVALQSEAELDGYTYRVAGCVGEFWTKMCRAHLLQGAAVDDKFLVTNGVRFGKGLQMINILRDLPRDLRQGRCYLPKERLATVSLMPEDLLSPSNEAQFRPVFNQLLGVAKGHLRAGWDYTNALPRSQARLRLACAWPILIGLKTIERLQTQGILDPRARVKISRGDVWRIVIRSTLSHPLDGRWRSLFN
jgi:farnesyl-diphosphate farnesyltransferase